MPDPFDLGTVEDARPGDVRLSERVTIRGVNTAIAIRVEGGEYSINGGAFTSEPGVVRVGDALQLRGTAPSTYGSMLRVTVSVGEYVATFTISTPIELPPITVEAEGGGSTGSAMLLVFALALLLRRRPRLAPVILLLALVPTSASAFDTTRIYAGARLGYLLTSADSGEVTRALEDQGYAVNARADADAAAAEVYAGYRLWSAVAVEGGYLHAGSRSVSLSGTAPPELAPLLTDATDAMQGLGDVLRLGVSAERRLGDVWIAGARLAGYRWNSTVSAGVDNMRVERADNGLGWTAGIGIRAPLGRRISLGLGADHWRSSTGIDFTQIGLQLQWDGAGQ